MPSARSSTRPSEPKPPTTVWPPPPKRHTDGGDYSPPWSAEPAEKCTRLARGSFTLAAGCRALIVTSRNASGRRSRVWPKAYRHRSLGQRPCRYPHLLVFRGVRLTQEQRSCARFPPGSPRRDHNWTATKKPQVTIQLSAGLAPAEAATYRLQPPHCLSFRRGEPSGNREPRRCFRRDEPGGEPRSFPGLPVAAKLSSRRLVAALARVRSTPPSCRLRLARVRPPRRLVAALARVLGLPARCL